MILLFFIHLNSRLVNSFVSRFFYHSMNLLFETPAGHALFRVNGTEPSNENVSDNIKLLAFHKFTSTADALSQATAVIEGKLTDTLKGFIKDNLRKSNDAFAIGEPKLGSAIAKKLGLNVVADANAQEWMRVVREHLSSLLMKEADLNTMALGLSHSLSRYKLKFSPDKVDTMIIQAVNLLEDLDKELNTYAMRVKEWYGWHFPELTKILVDNIAYTKTIQLMGFRTNAASTDLSSILPEDLEQLVKDAAQISMGTEISDEDISNIRYLCDEIIKVNEYRQKLYDYLKSRMTAIAPNLTQMVGELVGAKLISHAGSLMNLAKHPASTIQILGAEKALFRALKTKHDTPKYGLIYHSSIVGQAPPKLKGKIARVLATKTALALRCDALGEDVEIGIESRAKVENRLRQLEGKSVIKINKPKKPQTEKFEMTPYVFL